MQYTLAFTKGSLILVDYTSKVKDTGEVFETTIEEEAKKHSFYDKKLIALLKVAEETNQTEYIFQKLYDQYSIEIQHQGKIISNVLNFILTLFVGLIVGIILVAMYMPMFRLSSVIG